MLFCVTAGGGLALDLAVRRRPAFGMATARRQATMTAVPRHPPSLRHRPQQPRLTPLAAQDSKQQEQPAPAGPVPAALTADTTHQEGVAGPKLVHHGSQSPLGLAAELSQQIGLSPGRHPDGNDVLQEVAAIIAAAGDVRSDRTVAATQAAAALLPAETAAPKCEAASCGTAAHAMFQGDEHQRPWFSGWAEEWGQLLRFAQGMTEEAWQADPYASSYLLSPELGCRADDMYEATVRAMQRAQHSPHNMHAKCHLSLAPPCSLNCC